MRGVEFPLVSFSRRMREMAWKPCFLTLLAQQQIGQLAMVVVAIVLVLVIAIVAVVVLEREKSSLSNHIHAYPHTEARLRAQWWYLYHLKRLAVGALQM